MGDLSLATVLSKNSVICSKSDSYDDELYFIQQNFSNSVFSGETALYINMLIPNIPTKCHITCSSNYRYINIYDFKLEFHYVLEELITLGLKRGFTSFGNPIYYYDIERSICDIMARYSLNMSYCFEFIKQYQNYEYKNLNKLYYYADVLNLSDKLSCFNFL